MRYFITFACYGAHIHGDESGSVDRDHNLVGSRVLQFDPLRAAVEKGNMDQPPYSLDALGRATVLSSIQQVCSHRGWHLIAAHVRTNHVHVIVDAESQPDKVLVDFKSYSSRALNQLGREGADRKRWARHGSTRWLWKEQELVEAIRYVVEGQGEPMAVFIGDVPYRERTAPEQSRLGLRALC